jgi:small-conductance mechanosensitive channel
LFFVFGLLAPLLGRVERARAEPPPPPPGVTAPSEIIDRQTPRQTMGGFLKAAKEGSFRLAAAFLDLQAIPAGQRDEEGPELAQKLAYVLERDSTLVLGNIPDDPEGQVGLPDGGPSAKTTTPDTFVADTLYAGEETVPIALQRRNYAGGVERWLIAERTVALIPVLDAAYGPRPIGVRIPRPLMKPTFLGNQLWQWIGVVLGVFVAYLIARVTAATIVWLASYFTRRTATKVDDALLQSARRPLRTVLGALVYRALLGPLQLTTFVLQICEQLVYTAFVLGVAWLLFSALRVWVFLLDERAAREGYDAFRSRRERTQAALLHRIASIAIGFIAATVILLQFDVVRNIGVSLLASAGVLSVVIGFAAQKSLGTLVSGIQFSVAQPVRVGDQVVVEGEFGEIEEINLTYVVIRIWDKRQLIAPITYFLEKPFQNWTRSRTDLVGTVTIQLAHATPVGVLREELERICKADPLWDKGTCSLQVTGADLTSITVRATVSARDAHRLWDLRCNVRERLVAFAHSAAKTAGGGAQTAS